MPVNFKIFEEFSRTERESVEDFRSETRAGPGFACCYSPPLEEGWTRPQENIAAGILIGADGVVRNVFDHPVCASKVASQLFLIAQPPLL